MNTLPKVSKISISVVLVLLTAGVAFADPGDDQPFDLGYGRMMGGGMTIADTDGVLTDDSYPAARLKAGIPIGDNADSLGFAYTGAMIDPSFERLEQDYIRSVIAAVVLVFVAGAAAVALSSALVSRIVLPIRKVMQASEPTLRNPVRWNFCVTDEGPGIPERDRERVFNRFYRSDGSGTRATNGTGRGLVISKIIIEKQGGTISVGGNGVSGSRFEVALQRIG